MNQPAVGALPDQLWDVAIVGAGPAGSAAAILLASQGHRVLLADRERFPRDKVCGDGLTHHAIACLERLGLGEAVRAAAHEVRAVSGFSPSRVEVEAEGRFLLLKRIVLDALLAERAAESGATFCQGEARDVTPEADGTAAIAFAGCGRPARARIAVLATGANVRLARRLGMVTQPRPSAAAIRFYVRSSFPLDRMIAFYVPASLPGYAWVFPVGEGEYNVGCCALRRGRRGGRLNLRKILEQATAEFPLARAVLRAGEPITPIRGAASRCGLDGVRCFVERNVVIIGETAGTTLPLTGAGIGTAMQTGEMAASAIGAALASGDLEELRRYPAAVEARLRPRYMAYGLAERAASVRWLNDFVARRARRGGCLHSLARSVVAGGVTSRPLSLMRRLFQALAKRRARSAR